MLRLSLTSLVAALVTVVTASVAIADVALVIGNRKYQRAGWMYDAGKALGTVSDFRNLGYDVLSGRDLGIEQTRRILQGMMERIDDSERVAVVLNGHFVHTENDTWFVPVDANSVNRISINFEGISLRALLDILGSKPGGASLFLGTFPRDIRLSQGMERGIGDLDIPQGVFVATGKPDDIAQTLSRDFLKPGVNIAEALANAPESVRGQGFISARSGLGPTQDNSRNNSLAMEEGFWRAMAAIGTEQAIQLYLSTYPNGAFVADANAFLQAQVKQTPIEKAREAEARLNLSRAERRAIQENLSLLGYDTRGIDGVFGRGSRGAISAWQGDQDMEATGYLERRQINRLERQAKRKAEILAEEARRKQIALEEADRAFWESSGAQASNERGLRRYLRRYPDGLFSDVAELRLEAIEEAKGNQISASERQFWESASAADNIVSYRAYLSNYPQGAFAEEAEARLAKLTEEEENAALIEAAKKEEADLRMNTFGRVLVERQLIALGFDAGNPDGKFDKKSRKAIRQFQRTRGFSVTGYLTRQTVVRLIAEAGGG